MWFFRRRHDVCVLFETLNVRCFFFVFLGWGSSAEQNMHPVAGATLNKSEALCLRAKKGRGQSRMAPLPGRRLLPLFLGARVGPYQRPLYNMRAMSKQSRKKNNGVHHYSDRKVVPLNRQQATDDFELGRILVRVWPTGSGPIYRFRTDFRFMYPNGQTTEYIPDNALRELERAVRVARRKVRRLERLQFQSLWVRAIRFALGV